MKGIKRVYMLALGYMIVLISTLAAACSPTEKLLDSSEGPQIGIKISGEVIALTQDELNVQADQVFQGRVEELSATYFNQDSGEYWDGGLPFHTLTFEVLKPIVGSVAVGEQIRVTAWGNNPIEEQVLVSTSEGQAYVYSDASHDLKPGNIVIVFAELRKVVWREGTREILTLMGVPYQSYYRLQEDGRYLGGPMNESVGLEEFVNHIVEGRVNIQLTPSVAPVSTPSQ